MSGNERRADGDVEREARQDYLDHRDELRAEARPDPREYEDEERRR